MTLVSWIILSVVVCIAAVGLYYLFPKSKKDTQQLYAEALESLIRGDKEKAFWKLRELVKVNSNHVTAYIILGDILRQTQKPQQAVKIHQSLTARPKLTPSQKIDIYSSLAKDYYNLKQLDNAEEKANQVYNLDKKNQWTIKFLINLSEERESWDNASNYLKRLEKLTNENEPNRHAYYRVMQGRCFEKDQKYNEARAAYQKAINTDKGYSEAYLHIANLYQKESNLKKAVEFWTRFAELSPVGGTEIFSKLEKALYELGQFGQVEDFYSRIIDKNPNNVEALSGLINVLQAKGQIDRAMTLVDEALRKNSKSVHARLARLKLSLRRINEHQLSSEVDQIRELINEGNGSYL